MGTADAGAGVSSTCSQWTLSTGSGRYGTGAIGPGWSDYSTLSCSLPTSLLCFEQDTAPPPSPEGPSKRIFVTSQQFPGSFGGQTQADLNCANAAADGGKPGVWVAWLSTSTSSALSRISDGGVWYQESLDGGLLRTFNNRWNLATAPLVTLRYDERGQRQIATGFWTGTLPGGTASTRTCQNWTSALATETGMQGTGGSASSSWTQYGDTFCDHQLSLLCIEQ